MGISFSVVWKNARAKALYTAGKSLVKPATVNIARLMCKRAAANKLAMVLLSNNQHQAARPRLLSRYSETNYRCSETR